MTAVPHETASSLTQTVRALAANRFMARAVVAFGGFTIGEWGIWIAMLVYAFDRGGATAAGLVAVVQLAPSAVLAPVLAGTADRFRRERVLLLGYVAMAVTMTVTSIALAVDAPVPVVYLLAAVTTIGITITRPAHGSLLPSLARTPEELTAANVATGTLQNVGILAAPLIAGALLATAGPWAVFAATAAVQAVAVALVAGIRVEAVGLDLGRVRRGRGVHETAVAARNGEAVALPGTAGELELETADPTRWIAGIRELGREPGTRAVVLLLAAGSVIEGALDIVAVVLALELLGLGQGGVGIIGAAVGLGGLLGAGGAAALVGRARLAMPFVLGLLLWSLPLVAVGIVPNLAFAILVFLAAGFGRSVMDVAGRTLLQRVAPGHALSGVFGALEGLHDVMLGIGSLGVPALIVLAGPRPGLVLAGLWLPIVLVILWANVRAADAHAIVHVRELRLLRSRPVFKPLPPPTIEALSAHLEPVHVAAGQLVFRQGDAGDRFYVVEEGSVAIEIDGRFVRKLGPGGDFGEIALIRNVPRTASVRALDDVTLAALDGRVFVAAVSGHPISRSVAEERVRSHLGEPGNRP